MAKSIMLSGSCSDDDEPIMKVKAPAKKRAAPKSSDKTPTKKKAAVSKKKLVAGEDYEESKVNMNEVLTVVIDKMGKEEMDLGNKFKAISMFKAAKSLAKYPKVISSGAEAMQLPGVGKSIADKIDQILTTGTVVRSHDKSDEAKLAAVSELSKIFGITKAKATELVNQNITGAADLFGNAGLLDDAGKIGLKYMKDWSHPIPTDIARSIVEFVAIEATKIDSSMEVVECGALRREQDVDELHILVAHMPDAEGKKNFMSLLEALRPMTTDVICASSTAMHAVVELPSNHTSSVDNKDATKDSPASVAAPAPAPVKKTMSFNIPTFAQLPKAAPPVVPNLFAQRAASPEKAPATQAQSSASAAPSADEAPHMANPHVRVDIRSCTKAALPMQMLHWTGPAAFFKSMVQIAADKGFSLTDRCLRHDKSASDSKPLTVKTEEDIFESISTPFVAPADRK